MKLAEENIAIGDSVFELSVRSVEAEIGQFLYYGSCFCKACWKGEVAYDTKASIEIALEHARELASLHHREMHSDSDSTV